jgi:hypothetical protein
VKILVAILLGVFINVSVYASDVSDVEEGSVTGANTKDELIVNSEIEHLKNQVLELNSELFVLEEDLLFSANTQVSVFVSVDVDSLFELDSVQIKIDDKVVGNHLYTAREAGSLKRGGIQRLYLGNLTSGEHELTAFFIGKGPSKRNFKRAVTKMLDKTESAKFIELKIIGNTRKEQPDFIVKVWE